MTENWKRPPINPLILLGANSAPYTGATAEPKPTPKPEIKRPIINCATFCDDDWIAAPTHQKKAHNNNDALLPNGSEMNEDAIDPKNEPNDIDAVINPCNVESGEPKKLRYASIPRNADIDEISIPNINPEIHEIAAIT